MSPDFLIGPELSALRARVRTFVDERILPVEDRIIAEDQATQASATLRDLQEQARAEGLWTPHLPVEHGGLGLGVMGMCALFREMGRSVVGARVFHCDAPDQGNMDLLLKAGSPAVKERYLGPLVRGEITSAFCMTEPAPGAGADPSNLRTKAVEDGDGWVIDGHKWYSTGGAAASFLLVMARTSDDRATGCTMFLVDRHAEGVRHVRDIPVMGEPLLAHREAELRFEGVRVGPDAVLGGVGQGFMLAQERLVPARLTHCMRWLGQAARVLEMSREYLERRVSFGRRLGDHQLVQKKLADNAMAVHAGNLMTLHCAQLLEQGAGLAARPYSSMAKTHVARTLCQVLDDAIQLHGGLGYSEDVPFSRWYRWARAARIADGPDEVHEMVVARDLLKGRFRLLV
ncbi:MAG: acyl-CoA dehydrogenase family protein [Alphaproteobacteria bacterium]|nr:acyl-CoA dehydrogenase family protein [Alphaproteobacteria bacterium]